MIAQLAAAVAILLFCAPALAEETPAPFGVTWAASVQETAKILPGAEILWGRHMKFDAGAVIAGADYGSAMFSDRGNLEMLMITGQKHSDPRGAAREFDEFRTMLGEKYGPLADRPSFVDGYANALCGAALEAPTMTLQCLWIEGDVEISLMLLHSDEYGAFWGIDYTYIPEFAVGRAQALQEKAEQLRKAKDAL